MPAVRYPVRCVGCEPIASLTEPRLSAKLSAVLALDSAVLAIIRVNGYAKWFLK